MATRGEKKVGNTENKLERRDGQRGTTIKPKGRPVERLEGKNGDWKLENVGECYKPKLLKIMLIYKINYHCNNISYFNTFE